MDISFSCANCGQQIAANSRAASVIVECTNCGQPFSVSVQPSKANAAVPRPVKSNAPKLKQQLSRPPENTARPRLLFMAGSILFLAGVILVMSYRLAVEGRLGGSVPEASSDNPVDALNTAALKPDGKHSIESAAPALIQTVKVARADATESAESQVVLLAGFKSKADKAVDDAHLDSVSAGTGNDQGAFAADTGGVRMTLEQRAKGLVEFRGGWVTPQERAQREEEERRLAEHQLQVKEAATNPSARLPEGNLTDQQWGRELRGKSIEEVTRLMGSPEKTIDGIASLNFWYSHRVFDKDSGKEETLVVSFLNSPSVVRNNRTVYKVHQLGRSPIMFTDYVIAALGVDDYYAENPATRETILAFLQRLEHD
jgi:hypothetical protein